MKALRIVPRVALLALLLATTMAPTLLGASSSTQPIAPAGISSVPVQTTNPSPPVPASAISQSASADSPNVHLVSQIGGSITAVTAQGNYVYVGAGPRLLILDASTPATMTVVGQTSVLPDTVQSVIVSGAYAYVADGGGGLYIFNVSDPTSPTQVGSHATLAQGVAVANGYAYVTSGGCYGIGICQGRLQVVNVSNPAAPFEVGVYFMAIPVEDVTVKGNYAYVAASAIHWASPPPELNDGLWIFNVSTPAAPTKVGFLGLYGTRSVALAGSYAYVADSRGLHLVDVSNPKDPVQIGFYGTQGQALGVAIAGNYACVVDQGTWDGNQYVGQGVRVVNVSNPHAPVGVGFYAVPTAYTARGLAVSGNTAYYIPAGNATLRAVNVSTPAAPVEIGSFKTWGGGNAVAVAGNYAYVAAGLDGLQVVDISNPTVPHGVGSYDTPGTASEIAVAGNYAYIADGEGGLRVVNILTPTALTEVGFYTSTSNVRDVAVIGSYAYLACGTAGLRVVSVADPAHPVEVGSYIPASDYVRYVAVTESHAFVLGYMLYVVDVGSPAAPVGLGSIPEGYSIAGDLAVVDGYAYLVYVYPVTPQISLSGLHIVDVSDPISPTRVGDFSLYRYDAYAFGVAAANGLAYIAEVADHWDSNIRWRESNLCLVDVSTPATPTTIGCHSTPGTASRVQVAGAYIYAVGSGGLYILRESFSISGRVADTVGAPFAGVTVSASSGINATTDASGVYTLTDLIHGTFVLTPSLTGYSFWPPTRSVTFTNDARQQDFIILPGPVSVTLTTSGTVSLPAMLAYTDTQGLLTQVELPAGAVTQTTTLVLTPTLVGGVPGFAFAGHAFELVALQDGKSLSALSFSVPVTVTLHYSNKDVRPVKDKSQLALWWWTGSEWMDAPQRCDPASAYIRDVANNVLSVPICYLGRFGLFGPTYQVYLPLAFRGAF